MKEVEINGQTYRINKLDAFKQFHLSRRVVPLLLTLFPDTPDASKRGIGETLTPLLQAIGAMSDEDSQYVLNICLKAVQRLDNKNWQKIVVAGTERFMYDDIDMQVMVQLAVAVVQENLGSFFTNLPGLVPAGESQQDSTQ